jgi:hypothetical protein
MSLRDFNNAPFSDDPTALHTAPSGNGGGLESFHTVQPEDVEPNNMPKIIGAVAVALMVGVAGVALYTSAGHQSKPAVAASNAEPAQVQQAAMAPDATMPATPPAAQATTPPPPPAAAMAVTAPEKTPAPVKSASIAKRHVASRSSETSITASSASSAAATRLSADSSQSTVQPQQQQAVTQPTAPQPSPSDVAANNTQSGVAVPSGAATASDIPAPPASQPSAPAAAPQQPAAPAPTQPSGQVAQ